MNVLFVCLGNIVQSMVAEGILKDKLIKKGISGGVDSAGFESYHINEAPDKKAVEICRKHGIDISDKRCRLFSVFDFDIFDKIYVMDNSNYRDVQYFARNEKDMEKVSFLLSVVKGRKKSVPNPYGGKSDDFEKMFQLMDEACEKITQMITTNA